MYLMYCPRLAPLHLSLISFIALSFAVIGATSVPAFAGRPEATVHGEKIDIGPIKKHLVVAHDGSGHYFVAAPGVNTWELYYGDGKTFYKQIVAGGGSQKNKDKNSWYFFAPRERGNADLARTQTDWTLQCGKRKATYKTLSLAEQKKILGSAKFEIFSFRRQAHALLRDRRGIYYYIDKHRFLGRDYRLFVGRRGNMKKYKLVDIVDDSEGQIFITKKGDLNLRDDKDDKAVWSKGKSEKKLKKIPVVDNRVLIYTDLGPYENTRMRTPCEEL